MSCINNFLKSPRLSSVDIIFLIVDVFTLYCQTEKSLTKKVKRVAAWLRSLDVYLYSIEPTGTVPDTG